MVAAAEQNLDYPLYRDIRRHGVEAFQREIYDMAETREELAELENDALDVLGGISLRGHKISTVVIKKKKPVRRRKSDAEKELLALLDDYASDTADEPVDEEGKDSSSTLKPRQPAEQEAAKGRVIKAESAPAQKAPATPVTSTAKPKKSTPEKIDAVAAAKAILAAAAKEEDEKRAAAAQAATPRRTSRTNSNVKLELTIDDTINAQLAAITAAVDGVLAGDAGATDQLQASSSSAIEGQPETATDAPTGRGGQAAPQESKPTLNEVSLIISGKERRIMEAIERHRSARAQRTSDIVNAEKEQVQQLLSELNNRIESMDRPAIRVYH